MVQLRGFGEWQRRCKWVNKKSEYHTTEWESRHIRSVRTPARWKALGIMERQGQIRP